MRDDKPAGMILVSVEHYLVQIAYATDISAVPAGLWSCTPQHQKVASSDHPYVSMSISCSRLE